MHTAEVWGSLSAGSLLGMLLHPLASSVHLLTPKSPWIDGFGQQGMAEVLAKPYLELFATVCLVPITPP